MVPVTHIDIWCFMILSYCIAVGVNLMTQAYCHDVWFSWKKLDFWFRWENVTLKSPVFVYFGFCCFEIQCDSTSYSSPEEAQSPSPSICLDVRCRTSRNPCWICGQLPWLAVRIPDVCGYFRDGILLVSWLDWRIAGDISTDLLQHWYQFQVFAHASTVLNCVIKDVDNCLTAVSWHSGWR